MATSGAGGPRPFGRSNRLDGWRTSARRRWNRWWIPARKRWDRWWFPTWRRWNRRRISAQRRWNDIQWLAIGAVWVVALVLGYRGFAVSGYASPEATPTTPQDLLYLTVQLVILQSGTVPKTLSLELEIARFLAPGVAAYTAWQTVALLFSEQIQLMWLWLIRGHVVVCGLGWKGAFIAGRLRAEGYGVVVIEQDGGNDRLRQCREDGALVLLGDATDPELLRKARVQRARYLVAACGRDGTNAEVAVRAGELAERRWGKLTCVAHVDSPRLCDLLREREFCGEPSERFRLEFFSVAEVGARELLKRHSPFNGRAEGDPPHPLVVGLGPVGESLVVHLARAWWPGYLATRRPMPVTVVDPDAERKLAALRLRYPQLGEACRPRALRIDVASPEFQAAEFAFEPGGRCCATMVYVCLEDDSLGLTAALTLSHWIREHGVPIVVCMGHDGGLAILLRGGSGPTLGGFPNLHAFGLLNNACTKELVLRGTHEILARALHEKYLEAEKARGAAHLNMKPWEQLPEETRESNRDAVDHIPEKLEAVKCRIVYLTDFDADRFRFTPEEIDVMARMEHERWMRERLEVGWVWGPDTIREKRISADLVPWEDLREDSKQKDREQVDVYPAALAMAGLEIRRLRQAEERIH